MLRLLRKDVAPPDGWRYTHLTTGHRSTAEDYYTLVERVRVHCQANNLPVVSEAEIADQLCRQISPEHCQYDEGEQVVPVSTRMTVEDVVNGMKVFAAWMGQLFRTVEQDEAERRANVCARCYLNVMVEGCGSCSALASIIGGFAKSTSQDDRLKVCAVCKCVGKAQVWAPLEVLSPHMEPETQAKYPEFCWQKIGGENFVAEARSGEIYALEASDELLRRAFTNTVELLKAQVNVAS